MRRAATCRPGKSQWWSFGQPLGNVAFTAASRDTSAGGASGEEDRVLLGGDQLRHARRPATELVLAGAGLDAAGPKLSSSDAGKASRMILNLASAAGELHATLAQDDLADRQRGGAGVAAPPAAARATRGGRHGQIGREFAHSS